MSTEDNRHQTFDDSLLPEWAIHKQDEEVLSTFFGAPADRGAAESAFAIPRGETDQRVVSGSAPVVELEPEPEPELAMEPETQSESEFTGEEQPSPAPRRADFAKFRCIYESHDGQLALYEDEYGHLTAVNTNRFI